VIFEPIKQIIDREALQRPNLFQFGRESALQMLGSLPARRAIRTELIPIISQERICNEVGEGVRLGRIKRFALSRYDVPLPERRGN
jgi:hypothetical protein